MPSGGPDEEATYHMAPADLLARGTEALEWVTRYLESVEDRPVLSSVKPGEIRSKLPASPPQKGEPFEAVLADLDELILPGITHWQSPSFFAFFPANASGPGVIGDLLSSGLGVQGMLWATSPACTELETHVLDWLVEMLGLPDAFRSYGEGGGVIQDTASSATLCAVVAARERVTAGRTNREGVRWPLTVYASSQAHSSVEKAVRIAGIGSDNLRSVPVNPSLGMKPDELLAMIDRDKATGMMPAVVIATVGTTSTMAMDPLRPIGEICREAGIWFHVDAAMAGTAALLPEHRWIHDGLAYADSFCFNPHKWMFTNFDCDAFYVADRRSLVHALSILPEYLRNPASESGEVIDFRDWQVPLGRRFRALKLWLVIRHYGVEGLQHHVRRHIELAQIFAGWVDADDSFELFQPQHLNLVCFRHRDGDDATTRTMERVNAQGIYLTHSVVDGVVWLRMSIGQTRTDLRHVERAWELLKAAADS